MLLVFAQAVVDPLPCDGRGPVCEFVFEQSGVTWLASILDGLLSPLPRVVLVLVLAVVAVRVATSLVRRTAERAKQGSPTSRLRALSGSEPALVNPRKIQRVEALAAVVTSITAVVIWAMAVMTVLGSFGVDLAPMIAGAGIVGLALGFGAQDLVGDFLSGMFMLAEDQYGVGDIIDVGDAVGTVEGISLRTTRVRDVSGTLWHVPNGEIRRVGNMSQEWARTLLDIGVAYDADIDQTIAVIREVSEDLATDPEFAGQFLDPPEVWGVQDLAADSVVIRLVIKTPPGSQWTLARELRRRIKYALDDASIEIPFAQRTVWLRTDATGADPPLIDVVAGERVDGQGDRPRG